MKPISEIRTFRLHFVIIFVTNLFCGSNSEAFNHKLQSSYDASPIHTEDFKINTKNLFESPGTIKTKLFGDVKIVVRDTVEDESEKENKSKWPVTLPPRVVRNHFEIQGRQSLSEIQSTHVRQTEYVTFSYLVTSLLNGSSTPTTYTDIVIISSVLKTDSSNTINSRESVSQTKSYSQTTEFSTPLASSNKFTTQSYIAPSKNPEFMISSDTKDIFNQTSENKTFNSNFNINTGQEIETIVQSSVNLPEENTLKENHSTLKIEASLISLGPNIYGKLKTFFKTFTYYLTDTSGSVSKTENVLTQISTLIVSSLEHDISSTKLSSHNGAFPSSKVQLNADQLVSLKEMYASQKETYNLETSLKGDVQATSKPGLAIFWDGTYLDSLKNSHIKQTIVTSENKTPPSSQNKIIINSKPSLGVLTNTSTDKSNIIVNLDNMNQVGSSIKPSKPLLSQSSLNHGLLNVDKTKLQNDTFSQDTLSNFTNKNKVPLIGGQFLELPSVQDANQNSEQFSSVISTPTPGVFGSLVGGIANGLGGIFGVDSVEDVVKPLEGFQVDLGPVLDAVATLLRGPIRSAIANRRSESKIQNEQITKAIRRVKTTEVSPISFQINNVHANVDLKSSPSNTDYELIPRNPKLPVSKLSNPYSKDGTYVDRLIQPYTPLNSLKKEPVKRPRISNFQEPLDNSQILLNYTLDQNNDHIIDVLNKYEVKHLFGQNNKEPLKIKIYPNGSGHKTTGSRRKRPPQKGGSRNKWKTPKRKRKPHNPSIQNKQKNSPIQSFSPKKKIPKFSTQTKPKHQHNNRRIYESVPIPPSKAFTKENFGSKLKTKKPQVPLFNNNLNNALSFENKKTPSHKNKNIHHIQIQNGVKTKNTQYWLTNHAVGSKKHRPDDSANQYSENNEILVVPPTGMSEQTFIGPLNQLSRENVLKPNPPNFNWNKINVPPPSNNHFRKNKRPNRRPIINLQNNKKRRNPPVKWSKKQAAPAVERYKAPFFLERPFVPSIKPTSIDREIINQFENNQNKFLHEPNTDTIKSKNSTLNLKIPKNTKILLSSSFDDYFHNNLDHNSTEIFAGPSSNFDSYSYGNVDHISKETISVSSTSVFDDYFYSNRGHTITKTIVRPSTSVFNSYFHGDKDHTSTEIIIEPDTTDFDSYIYGNKNHTSKETIAVPGNSEFTNYLHGDKSHTSTKTVVEPRTSTFNGYFHSKDDHTSAKIKIVPSPSVYDGYFHSDGKNAPKKTIVVPSTSGSDDYSHNNSDHTSTKVIIEPSTSSFDDYIHDNWGHTSNKNKVKPSITRLKNQSLLESKYVKTKVINFLPNPNANNVLKRGVVSVHQSSSKSTYSSNFDASKLEIITTKPYQSKWQVFNPKTSSIITFVPHTKPKVITNFQREWTTLASQIISTSITENYYDILTTNLPTNNNWYESPLVKESNDVVPDSLNDLHLDQQHRFDSFTGSHRTRRKKIQKKKKHQISLIDSKSHSAGGRRPPSALKNTSTIKSSYSSTLLRKKETSIDRIKEFDNLVHKNTTKIYQFTTEKSIYANRDGFHVPSKIEITTKYGIEKEEENNLLLFTSATSKNTKNNIKSSNTSFIPSSSSVTQKIIRFDTKHNFSVVPNSGTKINNKTSQSSSISSSSSTILRTAFRPKHFQKYSKKSSNYIQASLGGKTNYLDEDEVRRDEVINNSIDGAIVESIPGEKLSAEEVDPETRCKNICGLNEVCNNTTQTTPSCKCRPGFGRTEAKNECEKSEAYQVEFFTTSQSQKITFVHLNHKKIKEAVDHTFRKRLKNMFHGSEITSIKLNSSSDSNDNMKANVESTVDPLFKSGVNESEVEIKLLIHLKESEDNEDRNEESLKNLIEPIIQDTQISLGDNITVSRVTVGDFDECSYTDHNDCAYQARCINVNGSYTCQCNDGYYDISGSLTGRVCSATSIQCDLCSRNGECVISSTHGDVYCQCRHWFAGRNCQINLKLLLIVGCVSIGLMITVACGVSFFCCKDRKSRAKRHNRHFPSTYGTSTTVSRLPSSLRSHGLLMDPGGPRSKPRQLATSATSASSRQQSSGIRKTSSMTSMSSSVSAWQSNVSESDATRALVSSEHSGRSRSRQSDGYMIPRAKIKTSGGTNNEDCLSQDEFNECSEHQTNRAMSDHTSLTSRQRHRSVPSFTSGFGSSIAGTRSGSIDPLLDDGLSDEIRSVADLGADRSDCSIRGLISSGPMLHDFDARFESGGRKSRFSAGGGTMVRHNQRLTNNSSRSTHCSQTTSEVRASF